MTNPNDPAFADGNKRGELTWDWGLTKREYFVAMAMQGIVTRVAIDNDQEIISESSCRMADALIAELNKTPEVKA
jgi:hypothetical protein